MRRVSMMKCFGRVGRGTGFICVIFALLATLGMSLRLLPELRAGGLSNPDTYMRLVRLREMLDSGTVIYSVARDGSGHGTVLHWSHLIDSLVCLIALPFSLVLKSDDALHAAALAFGPLNIAALGFAVAWAAAPFAERKYLWLAAILPPLSPAIASYGLVGVVHHHIAIVVVAVACAGWAARLIAGYAKATAGIAFGAWAGLGIWLTPETVPLTMMAFGALFLAWIVSPERDDIARAIGSDRIVVRAGDAAGPAGRSAGGRYRGGGNRPREHSVRRPRTRRRRDRCRAMGGAPMIVRDRGRASPPPARSGWFAAPSGP